MREREKISNEKISRGTCGGTVEKLLLAILSHVREEHEEKDCGREERRFFCANNV